MRLGLRGKALFFAAGLTFFASFLPVLSFYALVRGAIYGELQEKAEVMARGLAHNSRLAVFVGDKEKLDQLAEGVLDSRDVLFVAVLGRAGDFITSHARRQGKGGDDAAAVAALDTLRRRGVKPVTSIKLESLASGESYFEIVEPVLREAERTMDEFGQMVDSESAPEAIGSVAVGVSRAAAEAKILEILRLCAGVAIVVFVVGLVLAWFGTQLAVKPIVELARTAEIMAGGDLTMRVQVRSTDETGVLSRSFARMADGLKAILGQIHTASEAAEDTLRQAESAAGNIVDGSTRQSESVTESSSAILEMDGSIKDVARSAERMSSSVVGTTTSLEELGSSIRQIDDSVSALQAVSADASSSVLEMGANINEAAESVDDLSEQVERTASSIQEMGASIQNVDELAGHMRQSAEGVARAIDEMATSIREVRTHSRSASDLAESAARDVEDGRRAVQSTSEGMHSIRRSFDETRVVIAGLGESSRRIGEIVGIIDDVADRTNLLSLNAAIIAAEAGEQGRAFAVVAEEIRELAVKSAASTRDIGTLIRSVQHDVLTAEERMVQNDLAVIEGVEVAGRAADALGKIQQGASQTVEMAALIERATVHQLEQSVAMTGEMEKLRGRALEISRATEEQSRGSRAISDAVTEMRDKALQVKKSSAEQRVGGERISQGMEKVTEMIQQIARATREQAANAKLIMDAATEMENLSLEVGRATSEQTKSSAQVVRSVEEIQGVTEQNTRLAEEVTTRLRALSTQMAELRGVVQGLRI